MASCAIVVHTVVMGAFFSDDVPDAATPQHEASGEAADRNDAAPSSFLMMIRVTHAVTRTSKVFKVKLQIATTNRPRMSKRNKSCPQHAPAEESTQGKARANDWASCCNARLP